MGEYWALQQVVEVLPLQYVVEFIPHCIMASPSLLLLLLLLLLALDAPSMERSIVAANDVVVDSNSSTSTRTWSSINNLQRDVQKHNMMKK